MCVSNLLSFCFSKDFLVNSAREVLLLEVNPSPSLAMYRGSYGDLLGVESPLQEPLPSHWGWRGWARLFFPIKMPSSMIFHDVPEPPGF